MALSPETLKLRPVRVRLPGMPPTHIRLQDGQRSTARLQTISPTGGLLRVLKPLLPGAIAELRQALALNPSLPDAGNSLGLALMQHGESEAAVRTLRAVLQTSPDFSAITRGASPCSR